LHLYVFFFFFFSSRRRHTRCLSDWSSDVCSSDLIDMPADVTVSDKEVEVSFHRRAHLPILLASDLMEKRIAVPWWNGLPLRLTRSEERRVGKECRSRGGRGSEKKKRDRENVRECH